MSDHIGDTDTMVHSGPKGAVIPGGDEVAVALRGLTRVQRVYVRDGSIHGDCTTRTAAALRDKGLFHLVIDSPNGQWGFFRMTPLGRAVHDHLRALEATPSPTPHGDEGRQAEVQNKSQPTGGE